MRLGTCVAIELGIGAAAASVVGAASLWAMAEVRTSLGREAEAAEPIARVAEREPAAPRPTPPAVIAAPTAAPAVTAPPAAPPGMFLGTTDDVLLAPLRTGHVTQVKFNRGGSSISMRLDFDDGARAAFKPDQSNLQTIPRKEIAAYRVNRLLGLSSVAPAIGIRFAVADLASHLTPDSRGLWPRFEAEALSRGGEITGELSWWIPVIVDASIDGFPIDSTDGVVTWKRYLRAGAPIPAEAERLCAQLSDLVLFDFLIDNSDRWSGGNAKASEDGHVLYFMDNALSFGGDPRGSPKVRIYLERSQKFSRALVDHLRALTEDSLRAALAPDRGPYPSLLSDREIAGVMTRQGLALAYIDDLIAAHGAESVLVFP